MPVPIVELKDGALVEQNGPVRSCWTTAGETNRYLWHNSQTSTTTAPGVEVGRGKPSRLG